MEGGVNHRGAVGTGVVLGLFLLINLNCILALPTEDCSQSINLEFIKDDTDVCGYYICNGGNLQADPASGNLLHPCAPGTSTRYARPRSPYSPCFSPESICKGVAHTVKYIDDGGIHGGGHDSGHDSTTRRPTTAYPDGSGTTHPTSPSSTGTEPTHGPGDGHIHTKLSSPVAIFKNAHRHGGRHLAAYRVDYGPVTPVTSHQYCHHACDLNTTCVAYDWNEPTATCWIHTEPSACGDPVYKNGCVHVRLMRCGSGGGPTQPPVSDTTRHQPATPTRHQPASPTTTRAPHYPPVSTTGFTETHVGRHVREGRLVLTRANKQACLAYCKHFPMCAAVDYDALTATCWLHEELTACGELRYNPDITHYKRLTCQTGPDLAPGFLNSFQETHIAGGTPLCHNCTAHYCQHLCLADPVCAGVDYSIIYATCFLHGMDTVCGNLESKRGCMHYRRTQC